MSKNQFTETATQPQRNRNATANCVNLIKTSIVKYKQLTGEVICTSCGKRPA